MFCSCTSRPNCKRLGIAMIAVALYIFVYEMVFHGMILSGIYQETSTLWRSETDMQSNMPWLMLGQLIMAITFCYLYSFAKMCGGIKGGACFGLTVGLLMSGPHLISYAVQPIPGSLISMWIAGGILEAVVAGVIVAAIYKHDEV